MPMKAIETRYKGYRFRSRLEARWAVFFDKLNLEWEYEREGFELDDGTRYLPDFFLHGNGNYGPHVEIKGQKPTKDEIVKLKNVCERLCAYGLMVSGSPGAESVTMIHKEGHIDRDNVDLAEALDLRPGAYRKAVEAARSARFEFGERG